MEPLDLGLGISASESNQAQSGGPFTNNAEIVFGNGIFGAQYQAQDAASNPTSSASGKGSAVANPYASNATGLDAVSAGGSSTMLYAALAVIAVVGIWYFNK